MVSQNGLSKWSLKMVSQNGLSKWSLKMVSQNGLFFRVVGATPLLASEAALQLERKTRDSTQVGRRISIRMDGHEVQHLISEAAFDQHCCGSRKPHFANAHVQVQAQVRSRIVV
jgi:hypothetical protein